MANEHPLYSGDGSKVLFSGHGYKYHDDTLTAQADSETKTLTYTVDGTVTTLKHEFICKEQ